MQKTKPLTLRRNFSWTFIGNAVYAACQWGMLVVLAKLGSPEMVGQFTLGVAITAPVITLANLQLWALQITDARQEYSFGDFLGLRLITSSLAFAIIFIITMTAGYRWETSLVILLLGLAKAVESISEVLYGLLQKHERMDRIALSMIIKGFLSLFMLGVTVFITRSVIWGVLGLVIAWTLTLFSFDIRSGMLIFNNYSQANTHLAKKDNLTVELRPRWHYKTLLKLIWLALPLGIVMMLISLNASIPRYFIERQLGERELGVFAAIAYLMVVGTMVVSALGQSASPRLAKYYAEKNSRAFKLLLLKLVGIGAMLGVLGILVAIVAGQKILTIVYQPEYGERANLLVWLMVGASISYMSSFLGYAMTAAKYFRVQLPLFTIVTSISVIACFELIPTNGLLGGAIAIIITNVIQAILCLAVIYHVIYKLQTSEKYLNKIE